MRELLRGICRTFFQINAGAMVSSALLQTLFAPDQPIYVDELWKLLLISALTASAGFIFYSRRELGKNEMIIRRILHFFAVLTILLTFAGHWGWIKKGETMSALAFVGMFLLIYAGVVFFEFKRDNETASQLNKRLYEYKKKKG